MEAYLFASFFHIFVCCFAQNRIYQRLKDDIALLEDISEQLSYLLTYAMPQTRCIQIFTDNSTFATSFLNDIHEVTSISPLMLGPLEKSSCKGFIIISSVLNDTEKLIRDLPLYEDHRVVIIVQSSSTFLLNLFMKDKKELFRDSEVFLVSARNLTKGYKLGQPIREFLLIDNMTVPWKKQVIGIKDFETRKISVMTFNCSLFSTVGPLDDEGIPGFTNGAEMEIFLDIADRLNLSYEFSLPTTKVSSGLFRNEKWFQIPLLEKRRNATDIAFCSLAITQKKLQSDIVMSEPLILLCLKFLIPRPKPAGTEWYGIFLPFSVDLWISIGMTLAITTFILQRVTMMTQLFVYTKGIKAYRSLGGSFIQLIAILVLGSVPKSNKHQGASRHILTWWSMLAMVITTSFSSSLISNLTNQIYEHKIDTLEGFIENKYYWAFMEIPDLNELLNLENVLHVRWKYRMQTVKTVEQHIKLLNDSKHVLFGAQINNAFVLSEDNIPNKVIETFEATSKCFIENYIGFALRKGSPFNKSINKYIQTYRESGIMQKIFSSHFRAKSRIYPYVYSVLRLTKNKLAGNNGLTLAHLTGIFQIWLGGTTLSLIVFLLELCQRFHI